MKSFCVLPPLDCYFQQKISYDLIIPNSEGSVESYTEAKPARHPSTSYRVLHTFHCVSILPFPNSKSMEIEACSATLKKRQTVEAGDSL